MATKQLVPYGMVIQQFENLPDGLEQLEKAYPGITADDGYKNHVKVDAQSGAWMLEVPQMIQDEIAQHNVVEGAKISNTMAAGPNPYSAAQSAQAAPITAARTRRMSKSDMQASLSGAQGSSGSVSPFLASVLPSKVGGT